MVSSFVVPCALRQAVRACGFLSICALPLAAVVQVATGTPLEDVDANIVEMPLYFYSDEAVTAGQFDISVPEGWNVLEVDGNGDLAGIHSIEADALPAGGVRIVMFSLNNAEIPVGSVGTVVLEPPSVGEIANLTFSNPLFVKDGETILSLEPGFPDLQIVTPPLDQTVLAGQSTLLSVSALAIDPTYAWFEGASGDTSTPVGSASSLFQTPALGASTQYWVRVTDTFGEMVSSPAATITVDTGPTYIFDPNSRAVGWRSGSGTVALQTPAGNDWTATSSAEWLVLSGSSGTGPGEISYTYSANNSVSGRSAQIEVGGVTFTLNQSARPSIFADFPEIEGTGWRDVPWFGYVSDIHYPWVYHGDHGWLYIHALVDFNGFFAYSAEGDLGWLFISPVSYNAQVRWVYSFRYEGYLFFYPIPSLNPASRLFYDASEERWFNFPEN